VSLDPRDLPFPFPTVDWRDGAVVLIDQTRLPAELTERVCGDIPALCDAVARLVVRGAPALGIAAAWGAALSWDLSLRNGCDAAAALANLARDRDRLAATRPTAVNLTWALARQWELAEGLAAGGAGAAEIGEALRREARAVREQDVDLCRRLGAAGAALLPDEATVLTHCNAGGLATGGYGTALGVVYAAVEAGKRVRVYADETRPLLQGARLTAWELRARGVPVTLLCEGAAGGLLRAGGIDAVVVGADRIARNGDVANKVGTYPLAVLAREHGVPFYVAAPFSTYDAATPTGEGIVVELREAAEVTACGAAPTAPPGVAAWNPAFDVTPAALVTAIVTEHGALRPPYDRSLAVLRNG
jgi:methylthioribose-1-phosphate isomerase